MKESDECESRCVERVRECCVGDDWEGDERHGFPRRAPESRFGDAALEDPQFLGVCLGRLGENDFVDAEGGLVEDYFLALGWGKVDGFGDEEVHKRQDEGVDESTNAED